MSASQRWENEGIESESGCNDNEREEKSEEVSCEENESGRGKV
ncbi:hypothetical protein [Staphylococcus epidermidis]|nr:hypothetical protein [Staphylococcus epidermidis]